MDKLKIAKLLLFFIIVFVCANCSTNPQQLDFRKKALQPPSGITAMNANGEHVENAESDPSDWRTAPSFSGLFEVVTPAYPNPISYNSTITILINIKVINAVNGIYVYAFQQPGELQTVSPGPISVHTGLNTITISPQQFARSSGTGNFGNLYRIVLMDTQNQIITYGDVKVK